MKNWQSSWQTQLKVATLLLLCAGAASAQMYKYKDAAGVTHFTDTPPATAKNVETKSYDTGGTQPELPPELNAAVKANPVTLYTTKPCTGCDMGRDLLRARGVPYREKTVNTAADQAALKQAGGSNQLPFLAVGSNKLNNFEKGQWDGALTAAGYPAQSMLPKTFQQARVVPAGPQESADTAAAGRAKNKPAEAPKAPADESAPGFRF